MKNKNKIIIIIVAIFVVSGLLTLTSFAYFTATVQGNDNAYNTVITTGEMALMLNDGEQVSLSNAIPGDSITKEFSVKNTGTVETTYDVYFSELLNEFEDKNDLVYTLTSENGCAESNEKIVPSISSDESKMVSTCTINPNQIHNYTLTITFKDDGTNQDDNKGKKFSARISVNQYVVKEVLSIVSQISDLKMNGATDLDFDGIKVMGEYGTPDNNLSYIGLSPNNYVYFNCLTADPSEMNDETCEKWRIIGVFNNVEDANGNIESRVKITRERIFDKQYAYDVPSNDNVGNFYSSQWGESLFEDGTPYEGADLMRELNTDYLGNITVGVNGTWYDYFGERMQTMPTRLLSEFANEMIENIKWNVGEMDYDSDHLQLLNVYNAERLEYNTLKCPVNNCDNKLYYNSVWKGKVALFYPSDLGYSIGNDGELSKQECASLSMSGYGYNTSCGQKSWMFDIYNQYQYTLLRSGDDLYRFNSGANLLVQIPYASYGVRPTLYLKNNVFIDSGEGSSTNPYKLLMK